MSFRPSPSHDSLILLRWRWLILFAGILVALWMELFEPYLIDKHWTEIFFYGLFLPGVTWMLLTILARQLERQAQFEQRLNQLHLFIQQLTENYSSGQVLEFLARYPTLALPTVQTTLYRYDHHQRRFALWEPADPAENWLPASCAGCAGHKAAQVWQCPNLKTPAGGAVYCLPLAYDGLLLGLLQLHCPPGGHLSDEQKQFLHLAAPELALGLMMVTIHQQEVSQARSAARLDERRQISFTLHNSLAQQIGYLHLSLDRLADLGPAQLPASAEELAALRNVAGDAYQQVRDLLASLRSPEYHNLSQLVESRLSVFRRATGVETQLDIHGEPRVLSPETHQQIFSLIHEGLNNIQKHAAARRVVLTIEWGQDLVRIELADDGGGFDPRAAAAAGHYGLTMLHEQTADLHGTLTVDSAPGQGTRLQFQIPLISGGQPLPAPATAETAL